MNTFVIYHNDNDGFGAAFALWLKYEYGNNAIYTPAEYGKPVPTIPDGIKKLFILDISYDRATCEQLANKYELVIIDHHKTANVELAGCPFFIFDENMSAAMLTFRYFHGNIIPPKILEYVQDYDLWQFKLPYSKEVNTYITSLGHVFQDWRFFEFNIAMEAGKSLLKFKDEQIKRVIGSPLIHYYYGRKTILINVTENISDVCNYLLEHFDIEIAIAYRDIDNRRYFSLRSKGDVDVSEIAKKHLGGGHKNAAGFSFVFNLSEIIQPKQLVEHYV